MKDSNGGNIPGTVLESGIITKEVFKEKMEVIFNVDFFDPEGGHGQADDLFVEVLTSLGYDCSLFVNAELWYT